MPPKSGIPKEYRRLMAEHGFVLVRDNKHAIWRHPSGAQVVTPVSPRTDNIAHVRATIRRVLQETERRRSA